MYFYDGDTFEHCGHTFRVQLPYDEDTREPWKEADGHGIVSEWTRRDKAPGERVLCSDGRAHGSKRYYDWQATVKIALKDGWGTKRPGTDGKGPDDYKPLSGETKRAYTVRAVEADFAYLRGWCNNDWHYRSVGVTLLEEDEDGELQETDETEWLGGVEDSDPSYLEEVARELADQIIARIEVESPDVQLSEN